jgi:hypothetical protein
MRLPTKLEVVAFAERVLERVLVGLQRMRFLLIWWLLGLGARPMLLLRTGAWVDYRRGFAPDQVRAVYDAERHQVRSPGSDLPLGARDRWPWLAAVETDGERRDLSEFFGSLRVAPSLGLAGADVLALFVCQAGWLPRGSLAVTRRDGTEERVDAILGLPVAPAASGPSEASRGVDFVR